MYQSLVRILSEATKLSAPINFAQILSGRDEDEIYIPDNEIKYIEDKLYDLESEILHHSSDQWIEMKNLIGAVREELDPVPMDVKDGQSSCTSGEYGTDQKRLQQMK